ncbi:MAG: FKBP-type peptidyl-prolyl cis-trans isomerase [Phycisphaerales bacterium]|nr:FKBP-type peptidyl-prolyl cis-trans isomerase [Phycisphaerales bacterium]
MRHALIYVAALTAGLTGCSEKPAATTAPAKTAEAAPAPVKKKVDVSTLPGAPASGQGQELATGVLAWNLKAGDGAQLPVTPTSATFQIRGWTSDGTQWFGQGDAWDELTLPSTDTAAFPGWGHAVSDMRTGEMRKIWISGTDQDAGNWPVQAADGTLPDLILDIELVELSDEATTTDYPGAPVGNTVAQGSANGLRWYDLTTIDGQAATAGEDVLMTCTVWSLDGTTWQTTGTSPVQVTLDESIMPGLRAGLTGMTPGSTRKLIVPPSLGAGFMPMSELDPGATLVMDVTFVERPTTTVSAEPATSP